MALVITLALVTTLFSAEVKKNDGIALSQAPEAVQRTVKKWATEAEITKIEKIDEKGNVVYEVDITENSKKLEIVVAADNTLLITSKKSEIVVAADGTLLRTEETAAWADLPAAACKTIKTQAGRSKVSRVEKLTENGKASYEAVFMQEKKRIEITVAPDGKLLTTEDITNEND